MRIVIVCGICVEFDAISASVINQAEVFENMPTVDDVVVIAQHHDRESSIRRETVTDPWSLVRHPDVQRADLVVLHWGIEYALFDALTLLQRQRPTVVHFHNVTPVEFVAADQRDKIERSIRQMRLPLFTGTPIWAVSEFNLATLREWGYDEASIRLMPFDVGSPRFDVLDKALDEGVRLLSVGRLVSAKGIDVLLDAMRIVLDESSTPISLTLLGAAASANPEYLDQIRATIESPELRSVVHLRLDADDAEMYAEYERAHILVAPSLHEGLCVPVIEAYRAGCRVVGSDAGNLPLIIQSPDPIVPVGDADALAAAIIEVSEQVVSGGASARPNVEALVGTYSIDNVEAQLRSALTGLTDEWSRAWGQSAG